MKGWPLLALVAGLGGYQQGVQNREDREMKKADHDRAAKAADTDMLFKLAGSDIPLTDDLVKGMGIGDSVPQWAATYQEARKTQGANEKQTKALESVVKLGTEMGVQGNSNAMGQIADFVSDNLGLPKTGKLAELAKMSIGKAPVSATPHTTKLYQDKDGNPTEYPNEFQYNSKTNAFDIFVGKAGTGKPESAQNIEQLTHVALYDKDPEKRKQAQGVLDAMQGRELAKSKANRSIIVNNPTASKAGGGITLSEDALKGLAQRFDITGEIPGMGMGKSATEARTKVLNQWAADLNRTGTSVGDQAAKQAAYKASKNELSKLQSQRGTVMAFARTAEKNLDLALKLSEKVDRTGSPVINRWLLAGKRSVAGDPDVSAFDAALRTGINEYAKVTSSATGGGVTSDSARKEVESMLNASQTKEQIKSVMENVLRKDLKNRETGYDEQIRFIMDALKGGGSSKPPINTQPPTGRKVGRFTVEVE
jgi:hypothetical protein